MTLFQVLYKTGNTSVDVSLLRRQSTVLGYMIVCLEIGRGNMRQGQSNYYA